MATTIKVGDAERFKPGQHLQTKCGRRWRILEIDGNIVTFEPAWKVWLDRLALLCYLLVLLLVGWATFAGI